MVGRAVQTFRRQRGREQRRHHQMRQPCSTPFCTSYIPPPPFPPSVILYDALSSPIRYGIIPLFSGACMHPLNRHGITHLLFSALVELIATSSTFSLAPSLSLIRAHATLFCVLPRLSACPFITAAAHMCFFCGRAPLACILFLLLCLLQADGNATMKPIEAIVGTDPERLGMNRKLTPINVSTYGWYYSF